MLQWLATYLVDKPHRVKILNIKSKYCTIQYGVPQGSVLSPILFIIYLNELFKLPLKAFVVSFVDDTSVAYNALTWKEVEGDFKNDMQILGCLKISYT